MTCHKLDCFQIINSESVDGATNAVFRERVGEIWAVLIGHCDSGEEGTRNVAAECLGKLCLVDPQVRLGTPIANSAPHFRTSCATCSTA